MTTPSTRARAIWSARRTGGARPTSGVAVPASLAELPTFETAQSPEEISERFRPRGEKTWQRERKQASRRPVEVSAGEPAYLAPEERGRGSEDIARAIAYQELVKSLSKRPSSP